MRGELCMAVVVFTMVFIAIIACFINNILTKGDYHRGYCDGFEDGKLQKLVEFPDGRREYHNPDNLTGEFKIVENNSLKQ